MISLREAREFVVECVLTFVSIVSWVALAWAALDMAALLFWPPSPTKSKDPDLSGDFGISMLVSVAVLLLISVGARLIAPRGQSRSNRTQYWVGFGVVVMLWLAKIAERLLK